MKKLIIVSFILVLYGASAQQQSMKPLFNGKNLSGW